MIGILSIYEYKEGGKERTRRGGGSSIVYFFDVKQYTAMIVIVLWGL